MGFDLREYAKNRSNNSNNRNTSETPSASAGGFSLVDYALDKKREQLKREREERIRTTYATPFMQPKVNLEPNQYTTRVGYTDTASSNYSREDVLRILADNKIAQEQEQQRQKQYGNTAAKVESAYTLPEAPIGTPTIGAEGVIKAAEAAAADRKNKLRADLGYRDESGAYSASNAAADYAKISKATGISEDELRTYAKANDTGAQWQAYTALALNGDMSLDEFKNVSRQYNVSDEDAEGLYAYYGIEGLRQKIREAADSPYKAQGQYEIARYIEDQLKDRGYTAYGYGKGKYIMPAEYAEVILRETNAPEGGYTAENLAEYPARALALCAVDVTKNPAWEKEADQIYDVLYNNLFSKNDEWHTGGDIWTTVANNIRETARPTAVGIMLGLAKGLGSESVAKMISDDVNEKFDTSYARVSQLAPTATNISNTVGTIGLYTALAYLTGGVASSVVGAGASALGAGAASTGVKLATAGLTGAMTFGSVTALQNAGDYFRGNINLAEYGKRVGQSEIVGAATSLVSGLVSMGIDKAFVGRLSERYARNIQQQLDANTKMEMLSSDAVSYMDIVNGNTAPLLVDIKSAMPTMQTSLYLFTRNIASSLAGSGAFVATNALVTGKAPTNEEVAYQFALGFFMTLIRSSFENTRMVENIRSNAVRMIYETARAKAGNFAEMINARAAAAEKIGGDIKTQAQALVVELENLRRALRNEAAQYEWTEEAVRELATYDLELAMEQQFLMNYAGEVIIAGAGDTSASAAGDATSTAVLTNLLTTAMEDGITKGAVTPEQITNTALTLPAGAESITPDTFAAAQEGATNAGIPYAANQFAQAMAPDSATAPANTEARLTQLAEEAVAPTEPQVAPTATEAVVAPIEAEQTTRITPETENARNAEITAPRADTARSWEIIGKDFGENGQKAFAEAYNPEFTSGELNTVGRVFTAFYDAGKNNAGVFSVPESVRATVDSIYKNTNDATAMEIAAYTAGINDARLTTDARNAEITSDKQGSWNEIASQFGENGQKAIADVFDPELTDGELGTLAETFTAFYNAGKNNTGLDSVPRELMQAALEVYGNDTDAAFEMERAAVLAGRADSELTISAENDVKMDISRTADGENAVLHDLVGINEIKITDANELGREFYEIPSSTLASVTQESIPDNTEKVNTVSEKSDNPVSEKSDNPANTAMTMAEARRMIETAYRVSEIKEWYADEGTNQTVDEWLKNVGSDDIAMIIENDFDLQRKYINSNTAILDDEYQIEDVIDAYKAGTLVGKEKKKAQRLDVKKETGLKDDRFYAPREIENAKERFELAQQRITNANKQQVIQARADIVLFAHNRNAAELLGISQAELNKKLRSWTRYSASAREISERINAGVPLENRWTGIENSSFVNRASISQKDIDMLVKSVTGDPNGAERKYIARVMLALDTHIDYKGLNFIFESKAELNKKHGFSGRTNGVYNGYDTIACKYMAPNTVAHEMGHYLDTRFARDLVGGREDSSHYLTRGVNKDIVRERYGEDGVRFVDNFNVFMDGLTDVNDAYSSYSNDRAEVFARFVARFVEWTENVAAGYRMSNYEYNSYDDHFTTAQYVEFARLLQEKAMLDGVRANKTGVVNADAGVPTDGSAEKYDIGVLENGNTYVVASRRVITASDVPTMRRQITDFFQTLIGDDKGIKIPTIEGDVLTITKAQTGSKARDNYITVDGKRVKMADNEFAVKVRAEAHIDELAETSEKRDVKNDEKEHSFAPDGFVYRTAFFQDFDGKYYKITLSVGNNGETATVYNIGKIKEDKLPSAKLIAVVGSKPLGNMSSVDYDTLLPAKSQEEISPSQKISSADNLNPTENDDIRFSPEEGVNADLAAEFEALQRENAALRERLAAAKGQLKRTEQPTVRSDDVRKVARSVIKRYDSNANTDYVAQKMEDLGNLIVRGSDENGDATYTRIKEAASDIMYDIIAGSDSVYDADVIESHKRIRDTLRTTKLYVSPSERADAAIGSDSYEQFRKKNFGTLNLTSDPKALRVDVFYQELVGQYPWMFDRDITSQGDMLREMVDVANAPLTPSYNIAEEAEVEADDLLWRLMGEEVRQVETFADKAARKQAQAVAHESNKLNTARDKIAALKEEVAAEKAKKEALRKQKNRIIEEIKRKHSAEREDARERKERREAEDRLLGMLRRVNNTKLSTPNRAWFEKYFGDIYTVAKHLTGNKLATAEDLQKKYAELKENDPDFIGSQRLEEDLAAILDKRKDVASMTDEEIGDYTYVLMEFLHQVQEGNKMTRIADRTDVRMQAYNVMSNVIATKGVPAFGVVKQIQDVTVTNALDALRAVRRYTGYNDSDPLFLRTRELAEGQRAADMYTTQAKAAFSNLLSNKKFVRFFAGPHAAEIEIHGTDANTNESVTLKITPALRTGLYLNNQNDGNRRHITYGGVIIPDIELLKKGKISEAFARGTRVKFTPKEMTAITSGMTKEELDFARLTNSYFSETSPQEISKVYEELHGVPPKMVGAGYYPLKVADGWTRGNADTIDINAMAFDSPNDIGSPGWLKERKESIAPIYLFPADMVVNRSINDHGRYVGLAIPADNFNKLWEAKLYKKETRYNKLNGLDETYFAPDRALKDVIAGKWGTRAKNNINSFFNQILGRESRMRDTRFDRFRSRYARAVLELNPSVALKQMPSGIAAAAVVGYAPLAKAVNPALKIDTSFIDKMTASYLIRKEGYSQQELGELAQRGKKLPPALSWIIGADLATTGMLKRAAAFYVRDNMKELEVGSEAYKKAVVEVYDNIISETQPTYDVIYRANVLRSTSEITRALNMFRTQPFKNFNILYDALGNLQAKRNAYHEANRWAAHDEQSQRYAEEAKAAYHDAKKRAVWAFTSQAASGMLISLIMVGWDMLRGKKKKYADEDGEVTFWSFLKGLRLNFASTGAGMIPYGGFLLEGVETLVDAVTGDDIFDTTMYGFSVPEVDLLNDTASGAVDLVRSLRKAFTAEDGADWEKIGRAIYEAAEHISQFMGVPLGNARKTVEVMARQVFKAEGKYVGEYVAARIIEGDPLDRKSECYTLLYKAKQNDTEQYNALYEQMIKDGFKEDDIRNAMNKKIAADKGLESTTELANKDRYLNPDQQDDYNKMLSQVESTDVYKRYEAQVGDNLDAYSRLIDLVYDVTDGKKRNTWQDYAIVKEYGLTKTEYVLYQLALDIVDEPNKNGKYGTYTDSEKAAAVKIAKQG